MPGLVGVGANVGVGVGNGVGVGVGDGVGDGVGVGVGDGVTMDDGVGDGVGGGDRLQPIATNGRPSTDTATRTSRAYRLIRLN